MSNPQALYNVVVGDKIKAKWKKGQEIECTVTKINKFTVSTDIGLQFNLHNGRSHAIHYWAESIDKPAERYQLLELHKKYGDLTGAMVKPVALYSIGRDGLKKEGGDSKSLNGKVVRLEKSESFAHYTFGSFPDYTTSENILTTEDYDQLTLLEGLDIVELVSLPEHLEKEVDL